MKEGLWKRFKGVVGYTLVDSFKVTKVRAISPDKIDIVTYKIEFSTISNYDKKFWTLLRWFRMKYKQAAKEIRL